MGGGYAPKHHHVSLKPPFKMSAAAASAIIKGADAVLQMTLRSYGRLTADSPLLTSICAAGESKWAAFASPPMPTSYSPR